MTTHTPHRVVIAEALEDWWLTTDPVAPFDHDQVAEHVDHYLTATGYHITARTNPMQTPTPRPARPSRAATAFDAFLTLACLTGTLIALARHDWWWAWVGGLGTCLLGYELLLGIIAHHRGGSTT
ncbi:MULTISPECIES: hypothetical protein [unclassified Streptomyces]|uniref:hypothetical protein n=1 Tax=unclassified Streptomyces TaxID=2593676 RepID=UPI001CD478C1|nr:MULTISPECIES: hypothetical protein [unclassified Streptomyces]